MNIGNLAYATKIEESIVDMAQKIENRENNKSTKIIKRTIDVLVSLIGLVCLIPLTLIIYITNLINKEKGSIFFVQERIGKDGKPFKLYKYRTMVENAEEVLKTYLADDEEFKREYTVYKKVKNDPRITKIGKILRKTSLDEFPQFINVLKGDMSLVGPRPYLPREKSDMGDYYYYIVAVKPGLTGPWQISGRSEITFENRLKLDLEYYKDNSLKTDMRYLVKTFGKVFKDEGAV